MCSRWNAFEERSLLREVAQAASAAAEQIEHLHNLLGYNTEDGDTAVINIRRALSEIEYRQIKSGPMAGGGWRMGSSLLQNWLDVYVNYLRRIVKLLIGLPIYFFTNAV